MRLLLAAVALIGLPAFAQTPTTTQRPAVTTPAVTKPITPPAAAAAPDLALKPAPLPLAAPSLKSLTAAGEKQEKLLLTRPSSDDPSTPPPSEGYSPEQD